MNTTRDLLCERAIVFLTNHVALSDAHSRKPRLMHAMRVGMFVYNRGWGDEIVVAGFLHDTIEWEGVTADIIADEFGTQVTSIVLANTRDRTHEHVVEDMIRRCVACGKDALIVKVADIIDSFMWYTAQRNTHELIHHCAKTAQIILKYKPQEWQDEIFDELTAWQEKCNDWI